MSPNDALHNCLHSVLKMSLKCFWKNYEQKQKARIENKNLLVFEEKNCTRYGIWFPIAYRRVFPITFFSCAWTFRSKVLLVKLPKTAVFTCHAPRLTHQLHRTTAVVRPYSSVHGRTKFSTKLSVSSCPKLIIRIMNNDTMSLRSSFGKFCNK